MPRWQPYFRRSRRHPPCGSRRTRIRQDCVSSQAGWKMRMHSSCRKGEKGWYAKNRVLRNYKLALNLMGTSDHTPPSVKIDHPRSNCIKLGQCVMTCAINMWKMQAVQTMLKTYFSPLTWFFSAFSVVRFLQLIVAICKHLKFDFVLHNWLRRSLINLRQDMGWFGTMRISWAYL